MPVNLLSIEIVTLISNETYYPFISLTLVPLSESSFRITDAYPKTLATRLALRLTSEENIKQH